MSEMPISEARAQLSEVVELARRGDPVVLTRHGQPVAVVLDIEEFDRLVDAVENEEDLRAARRALTEDNWIPWDQVKADLGLE